MNENTVGQGSESGGGFHATSYYCRLRVRRTEIPNVTPYQRSHFRQRTRQRQAETIEDRFAAKCEDVFRDVFISRVDDEFGDIFCQTRHIGKFDRRLLCDGRKTSCANQAKRTGTEISTVHKGSACELCTKPTFKSS